MKAEMEEREEEDHTLQLKMVTSVEGNTSLLILLFSLHCDGIWAFERYSPFHGQE
jgi:hypothetical protein